MTSKVRRLTTALLLATPAAAAVLAGLYPASASAAPTARSRRAAVPVYCHSGGIKLWENLATCGWPNSANTGPQLAKCPGGKLAQRGNGTTPIVLSTANQVISCADLRGPVEITAAGVTIRDSMVTVTNGSGVSGSAAVTIEIGGSATINTSRSTAAAPCTPASGTKAPRCRPPP
jgi:hypothetical protein